LSGIFRRTKSPAFAKPRLRLTIMKQIGDTNRNKSVRLFINATNMKTIELIINRELYMIIRMIFMIDFA